MINDTLKRDNLIKRLRLNLSTDYLERVTLRNNFSSLNFEFKELLELTPENMIYYLNHNKHSIAMFKNITLLDTEHLFERIMTCNTTKDDDFINELSVFLQWNIGLIFDEQKVMKILKKFYKSVNENTYKEFRSLENVCRLYNYKLGVECLLKIKNKYYLTKKDYYKKY